MGVFNTVYAVCPECGSDVVEFQSKAIDGCGGYFYDEEDIPEEIVRDLDGEVSACGVCGHQCCLGLVTKISQCLEVK